MQVDLSRFAGQKVYVEVVNQSNNWNSEYSFWKRLAIVDKVTGDTIPLVKTKNEAIRQFCIRDQKSHFQPMRDITGRRIRNQVAVPISLMKWLIASPTSNQGERVPSGTGQFVASQLNVRSLTASVSL